MSMWLRVIVGTLALVTVVLTGVGTRSAVHATTTSSIDRHAGHQRCASGLANTVVHTGSARQLVIVDAPVYRTTVASLSLWRRVGTCWQSVAGPWTARIGANGFTNDHREGDESTPTGAYQIGPIMYGNAPNPGVRYPYHRLVCGDWWDEDPSSSRYNTFEHVACGTTPPLGGDSEALWRETVAYPSFAVVDFNIAPVVSGAGSGIFIHADIGAPTAGCVSLPLGELEALLRWLDPRAHPIVVMGQSREIATF